MRDVIREVITFSSANWPVLLFLLTVLGLVFGRLVYHISPFYWLEEIKQKQDDYRAKVRQEEFKLRMVSRHIELASALLDAYEIQAAKAEYQKALQLDSMNVEAQMGLLKSEIFLSIRRKDYSPQVAQKQLKLIQAENPDDKHALLFLGDVYSSIDQDRALQYYTAALQQDPSLAIAYNNIGVIYDERCQFDKSSENYEKAAELAQWNTDILANVAYHSLRKKRYNEAINQFELLLRLDGKLLWAHWSLAQAYWLTGNIRAAYDWQRHLLRLLDDEEVTSLPLNRGQLLFHVGDVPLYVYDLPQMRCYSYYSMALTCHLLGMREQAEAFIQKARDVAAEDQTPPKTLLVANVAELQRVQSGLRDSLQDFMVRYFS
jgi:tetratricopeptide (TPR) repeat protein